jgi:hypothetical protein
MTVFQHVSTRVGKGLTEGLTRLRFTCGAMLACALLLLGAGSARAQNVVT